MIQSCCRNFSTNQNEKNFIKSNISRHVIVKSNISKFDFTKYVQFKIQNQTFSSIHTNLIENIFCDITAISSLTNVNLVFWNNIMIVTTAFAVVSQFVVEIVFVVNNSSIIKFVENIDFFDFDYKNLFDINQFIVIFERYNFYRNVFIFVDHFKNLKKNFFRF